MCIDVMFVKYFVYYHIEKDDINGIHDIGLIKTVESAKSVVIIIMIKV